MFLWAYKTITLSTIEETPFRLTYITKDVIPVKVREIRSRMINLLHGEENSQAIQEELDFLYTKRCFTALTNATVKKFIMAKYNKKLKLKKFHPTDLVLLIAKIVWKNTEEKLTLNLEGSYRI